MPAICRFVVLAAAAALLSGCGGGGGGSATVGRCVGTGIFGCLAAAQWSLGRSGVRVEPAWRRIAQEVGGVPAPGDGQTVGLIDDGIDQFHPTFCKGPASTCSKTVTEQFVAGATDDQIGAELSHGTATAGVIVGRLEEVPGVAYGADVAMFAIPLGSGGGGGNYVPLSLTDLFDSDDAWAFVFSQPIGWSRGGRTLDFINASFSIPGIIDQYSVPLLSANFDTTIAALAQAGVSNKKVFVFAAGNAHGRFCDPNDYSGNPDLCQVSAVGSVTRYRVNAKSPSILAGLPARIAELRGHVLSVVAVGRDGRIASFSNRCGIAAQWCLAAPGEEIGIAYFGPNDETGEPGVRGSGESAGTSFAAPLVTGALVVMKHRFRDTLSNTQLVARLLATARDTGIYADSAVYGHGLLDLEAATAPVGRRNFARGKAVDGPGDPVTQTRFSLGNAFGNAVTRAFAGQEIVAFDSLGAPFWYPLGGLAHEAPHASVSARVEAFMAPEARRPAPQSRPAVLGMVRTAGAADSAAGTRPSLLGGFAPAGRIGGRKGLRFGFVDAPAPALGGGHLALASKALAFDAEGPNGLGLTLFSTEGMRGRTPVSGALLSWRPAPDRNGARNGVRIGDSPGAAAGPSLRLTGGWMAERQTMLGSRSAGAFGRLSTGAAFAGFEAGMQAGAWRLDAGAEFGLSYARAGGGMVTGLSPLVTSAFALRAERQLDANSSLRLSVSQPLRVESGRARLSIPVSRTQERTVLRRSFTASLAPEGRQFDVAARWRKHLDSGGELRLGATWTLDPGHDTAARSELTLLAGWRRSF